MKGLRIHPVLLLVTMIILLAPSAYGARLSHDRAIKVVRQAYCRVLERPVDESGLVTYAAKLERGEMTARELVRILAKSREHQDRFFYNNTPRRYSSILVDHVLAPSQHNRVPDTVKQQVAGLIVNKGVHHAIDFLVDSYYPKYWRDNQVPGKGRPGCK